MGRMDPVEGIVVREQTGWVLLLDVGQSEGQNITSIDHHICVIRGSGVRVGYVLPGVEVYDELLDVEGIPKYTWVT